MKPQRIMIFGLPGAGKSTFAAQLAQGFNLPLYHLDKYFFAQNWVERDKEEFLHIQQQLVDQDCWIIDGNALNSLEMRYRRAEHVLYFCKPRVLCMLGLIRRRFFKDDLIQDRAKGCEERLSFRLIHYMWTFEQRVQPLFIHLQHAYPQTPFYKISSFAEGEKIIKAVNLSF